MLGPLYDFLNGLLARLSLAKGQNAAGTLTGDYVSVENINGPVTATVMTGNVTGSPSAQSSTFTLMEADDSGGTGAQAVANQSDAVVITADKGIGMIRGQLTKPYVAVKCVLSLTGGSTPKQDVFGVIHGAKNRV